MSLERSFFERMTSTRGITDLVPTERIVTGAAFDAQTLPLIVITDQGSSVEGHTSSGREYEVRVLRVHGYASTLDTVKSIRAAVRGALNRRSFLISSGRCLLAARVGGLEVVEADGTWHAYDDYRCVIEGET